MRRRSAVVLSLLIGLGTFLSVASVGIAGPGQRSSAFITSHTEVSSYCATAEEVAVFNLINDYRKANGLGALVMSQTLGAAAEHHSQSMDDYNYFSHELIPEGIKWSQNMINHGYDYNTWRGEIIAGGQLTPTSVVSAWKNSPSHNDAMLSPNFKAAGVGRVANAPDYPYWTVNFGGYVDAPAKICGAAAGGEVEVKVGAYRVYNTGRTSNSRVAKYCLDGRQSTSWYTVVTTPPSYAYVWFDLGSVKSIGAVKWKFNRTGYADYFEIQVSNDRRSWQAIGQGTNGPSNAWQTLDRKANARYVRFLFRNPKRDAKLGYLSEVRIYP